MGSDGVAMSARAVVTRKVGADELVADLVRRLPLASRDELRIVDRVFARLEIGRRRYGLLDLSLDCRDWRAERFEERLDALIYDIAEEIALEDAAGAAALPQLFVVVDATTGRPHPCSRAMSLGCTGWEREAVPVYTSKRDAWEALAGGGAADRKAARERWRVVPLTAAPEDELPRRAPRGRRRGRSTR